jgi:hypothetical protein
MTWPIAALIIYLWLAGGLLISGNHFEHTHSKAESSALLLLWPIFLPGAWAIIVWRAVSLEWKIFKWRNR